MLQLLKKRLKNQKGLSLVELLAVIVILGIVSAIAVPAIGGIIENSRYNAVKAEAINVINAANLYYIDTPNATKAVTVKELADNKFLESKGKFSDTDEVSHTTPRALTTKTAIKYSGDKEVTFTGATVDVINTDSQKGSEGGNKTIPATPATP